MRRPDHGGSLTATVFLFNVSIRSLAAGPDDARISLAGDQAAVRDRMNAPRSSPWKTWRPRLIISYLDEEGLRLSSVGPHLLRRLVNPVTVLPIDQQPAHPECLTWRSAPVEWQRPRTSCRRQRWRSNSIDRVLVLGQIPHRAMAAGVEACGVVVLLPDGLSRRTVLSSSGVRVWRPFRTAGSYGYGHGSPRSLLSDRAAMLSGPSARHRL